MAQHTTRALLVGVSQYSNQSGQGNLPAVKNDLAKMAKLLASPQGVFQPDHVKTLLDSDATGRRIREEVEALVGAATEDETVLLYFAGHGKQASSEFVFVPYEGLVNAVELRWLRQQFEACRSKRALMFLDICQAGGIVNRSAAPQAIRRQLRAFGGEGRIILAACTQSQSSYEEPTGAHGYFTRALLEGLQGKARNQQGVVTPNSLHDHISYALQSQLGPHQTPVMAGEIVGTMVLMHQPAHPSGQSPRNSSPPHSSTQRRELLMLSNHFIEVESAEHQGEVWTISTGALSRDAEVLVNNLVRSRKSVPFVYHNTPCDGSVLQPKTTRKQGQTYMTFGFRRGDDQRRGFDAGYSGHGRSYTAQDIREIKAEIVLGIKQPDRHDDVLSFAFRGDLRTYRSPLLTYLQKNGVTADSLEQVRLIVMYELYKHGAVDEVVTLKLEPQGKNAVRIHLVGQRQPQYHHGAPDRLEVSGVAHL